MICAVCGGEIRGIAINTYGSLSHPDCRSGVTTVDANTGPIVTGNQLESRLSSETYVLESKLQTLERRVEDLLWKNKTKFGNYRG